MKKINKILSALVASLAIGFVATSLIACSDDDDDDVSTVAVYKDSEATADSYETITFFSDNTVKGHSYEKYTEEGFSIIIITDFDTFVGTYTGNPTADGTVKITVSKMINEDAVTEEDMEKKCEAAYAAGKTSLTFTNSDFPLEAVSDVSIEAVVSGKTATVDFDGDSDTYTRQ